MFDRTISKKEIIKIVGKALQNEVNGKATAYTGMEQICLYGIRDKINEQYFEMHKFFNALLDYLGLEVVETGGIKVQKKGGKKR